MSVVFSCLGLLSFSVSFGFFSTLAKWLAGKSILSWYLSCRRFPYKDHIKELFIVMIYCVHSRHITLIVNVFINFAFLTATFFWKHDIACVWVLKVPLSPNQSIDLCAGSDSSQLSFAGRLRPIFNARRPGLRDVRVGAPAVRAVPAGRLHRARRSSRWQDVLHRRRYCRRSQRRRRGGDQPLWRIILRRYGPNFTRCVTSRHDKHDVSCESWRDVLCRACGAVLVPTWRTTKKQYRSRVKRYHVLLLFIFSAHKWK